MGMGQRLTGRDNEFTSLLDPTVTGETLPTGELNTNTNFCLFRYSDDDKKYRAKQKCMIHQDSGVITLLPR